MIHNNTVNALSQAVIHEATQEDIEGAIDLLREFHDESLSKYGLDIDIDIARQTCLTHVNNSFVLKCDGKVVGVISGYLIKSPSSPGDIFQEAVWFVSKPYRRYGLKLLEAIEDRCRDRGVTHILMGSMHNSMANKLDIFYRKHGFVPFQTHYIKSLTRG